MTPAADCGASGRLTFHHQSHHPDVLFLDAGLVPALARASDLRVAQLTRPACELVRVLPPRGDKGLARPIMLPQRADSRLRNHPLALTRALTLALTRPSASCSPSSSPLKHISLTPGVCLRLVERRRARGELASHPAPERLPRRRRGQLEAGAIRGGGRAWEGTLLEGLDSGSDRCEEVIQLGLKRDTACNAQRHRSIYPHLSHPSTHPPLQLGYGRPSRRRRRSCRTSRG